VTLRRCTLFATICLTISFLTGCGSNGGSSKTSQVAVSLSAPGSSGGTVSLGVGQTLAIVAIVANDSSNAGVAWSLNGPGSLSNQSTTSVQYTAPSSLQAATTATVTATSSDSNVALGAPFGPASTPVSGTYAVSSNGRGTITQNGSVTGIFYMASPTQMLMIPNGSANPTVVSLFH
jgi:hypothetical protein